MSLCQLLFDTLTHYGRKAGAVVRVLASHQFGLGLNLRVDDLCGLTWLLVLSLALRDFSPGTPVFPSPGFVQMFGSKIQDVFQNFFQNNNLFIQTHGYLIGDQHAVNRACFCLFLYWVRQNRASERTVFSLNFSSAGKGPFMASKAINTSQRRTFLGDGDSGVRDMASNSLWNLGAKFAEASFPHFKTDFTQISRCYL